MGTPFGSVFALAAPMDKGRPTAWAAWLRDLLLTHHFALESRDQVRAQTIHGVTVRAGPRDVPVLVEDRRGHACSRRRTATARPIECIRIVLQREGAATSLDTHWYPTGPHNEVPLDCPSATVPRILISRDGALDPIPPGRIARLLTEHTPGGAAPHSAERLLVLAGQLASILPHAGSDEATRAARGAALQIYLKGKPLALDAPTRESLRTLLGEDTARFVAARNRGKTVPVRSLTVSA